MFFLPAMLLAVSADDDPDAVRHILRRGASAFIAKPVASDTVADVLAHAARGSHVRMTPA